MRLYTQTILGHTGLTLAFIAMGALGIGLIERMTRLCDSVLVDHLQLVTAAQALERSTLLYQMARQAGTTARTDTQVRLSCSEVLAAARTPEARELVAKFPTKEGFNLENPASLERFLAAAARLTASSVGLVRQGIEHSSRMGRSGVGLVALVGIVGLLVALYFGYWLSKMVMQPMERLSRGLDEVLSGNSARRFSDQWTPGVMAEFAAGLNELVDRLQRSESTPRVDLLTVCAAVEKLCEQDSRASGVLAGGHRLLASNEAARKLVLERNSSFQWIAAEVRRQDPSAVEILSLDGPGGEKLGDLMRIQVPGAENGSREQ